MMDADQLALLATTLGQLAEAHDGAELTKALDDFGFAEVIQVAPRVAVSALFEAMGRTDSICAALQDVLALPFAGTAASGEDQAVLLPPIGAELAGSFAAGTVVVRGLVLGHRPAATLTFFVAPVSSAGQTVWVRFPDTAALTVRPVAGLDPELGLAEVTGSVPADAVLTGEAAEQAWRGVAAAGRRALGYQMLGAASAMIGLATEHARTRVQFGRPVGSFQAVRHRLAEAFVAREAAAAALELSWEADDEELAAMLAKSLAGRAARITATHCQQVLAGLGFTAEHPFHRYLTRALVLDRLLGSAAELPAEIGARLAAAGRVPRLAEL
jgi:Acyl-CoA dehydrogenase, C-terminal domain